DERQNKLFHQSKNGQVSIASDLVQRALFVFAKESQGLSTREAFRHKRPREVESLAVPDDVLNSPAWDLGQGQRRLICISVIHLEHLLVPSKQCRRFLPPYLDMRKKEKKAIKDEKRFFGGDWVQCRIHPENRDF